MCSGAGSSQAAFDVPLRGSTHRLGFPSNEPCKFKPKHGACKTGGSLLKFGRSQGSQPPLLQLFFCRCARGALAGGCWAGGVLALSSPHSPAQLALH